MKNWLSLILVVVFASVALVTAAGLLYAQGPGSERTVHTQAAPLGTAFTYQGQLGKEGQVVSDTCDFQFGLWDSGSAGGQLGITQTLGNVRVATGLFTVQVNGGGEFGTPAFNGEARWLAIAVRCPAGSGDYASLGRQALTAAPYAIYAQNIPLAGPGSAVTAARSDHDHNGAYALLLHTHPGTDVTSAVSTATLALAAQSVPWSGLVGVPAGAGDVSGTWPLLTVTGLQGRSVADIAPGLGQALGWDGSQWAPATLDMPPVVVLQAHPSALYLGETNTATAVLSLTLSYDPRGGLLSYAFDATGRPRGLPPAYGNGPTATAVYSVTGNYLARGWAQTATGLFATAQAPLSVYRFGSVIVDDSLNNLSPIAMAVVAGHPAIVHDKAVTQTRMIYLRSLDAAGANWALPAILDHAVSGSFDPSVAVVNGRPAVAYYAGDSHTLRYVRALDSTGATWEMTTTVDSAYGSGYGASLAVVNSRPAIAYIYTYFEPPMQRYDLRYVRANDVDGGSWPTPTLAIYAGFSGVVYSLLVVEGKPAILYVGNDSLNYIRANDADGTSWGSPVAVGQLSTLVGAAQLAVVGGRPAVAYYGSDYRLKYVRANDSAGASWGAPVVVDEPQQGRYASLVMLDGGPAIAYVDDIAYDLKFVQALDDTGVFWGAPIIVDSSWNTGCYATMAVVDGRPAIAYKDYTNLDMRFSIPRQD